MQADAVTGGKLDGVGGGFAGGLHLRLQRVVEPEDFQKVPVAEFTRRSQLEEAVVPLGQPRAEGVFQGQKQIAGVGLGAVVPFCGPGEVLGGDDIAEQPQGFHLHDSFSYTETKNASIFGSGIVWGAHASGVLSFSVAPKNRLP
jgi:hypothetical protein